MTLNHVSEIKVSLRFDQTPLPVGRLAIREGVIYFQYDEPFLARNLEISPFHLPLQPNLKRFDRALFEGLPGVFNDSLPDGWGRLVFDRFMRTQGILPVQLSPLDCLTYVGSSGMGALVYEPHHEEIHTKGPLNLDTLARHAHHLLEGEAEKVLAELLDLNGSSAGARPKAMIGVNKTRQKIIHGAHELEAGFDPWLVKFANAQDGSDAGAIEYVYSLMAKDAGLPMMDTHLFLGKKGAGYFASKRFDRGQDTRLHVHTACGLLHSDFRIPSLDYEDLLALTQHLTRDVREVKKMFRLAVFNVLSHNRDDHGKNFSFLMDANGQWRLAPPYDLTFSSGPYGEHSTTIMGNGTAPTFSDLLKLGESAGLNSKEMAPLIQEVQDSLQNWRSLASKYGVRKSTIALIESKLNKG